MNVGAAVGRWPTSFRGLCRNNIAALSCKNFDRFCTCHVLTPILAKLFDNLQSFLVGRRACPGLASDRHQTAPV